MVMASNKNRYKTQGNVAYKVEVNEKNKVKKVEKPKKSTNKNIKVKLKVLRFILFTFALSIFTLSRFVLIYNMNTELRELKSQVAQVQKENQNLQVSLAVKNNIKKIEGEAVKKYNMVNPKAEEVKYVDVKMLCSVEDKKVTAYKLFQKFVGFIH
ncbi:hypothetical protein [Caloramator proteoclasticus]|uniref:Cell division protein FtsL n=1 Tax=Caloramator proteoclasticus DSM 10124 TaxID=1121262 RepID=A0A1M4UCY2_9CLOT|nr:hypothetical protein [Caloramator proteoclasticus]SHE54642.1 hypothetical protein SAMN02746091_00621 [Caloramator proteoclasticus DSM 10124]